MVFELLNKNVQKLVAERFEEPTITQKFGIPPILEGKNVLLIAPVGSGKTESCMLPIFSKIIETNPKPISTLYITPLKSLNRDLLDRLNWWSRKFEIEIAVRHGDTSQYERKQQLEFPPQLLIITLETLQPLLTAKRMREHLRNIKYIILDEVHEAVDSKRGVQLSLGLERLKELCNDFQLVALSATVGMPEKVAEFFSGGRKVEIIKATAAKAMSIKVIHPKIKIGDKKLGSKIYSSAETAARLRTIQELINQHRSVLAFTNTREFAEILSSRIKSLDKNFPIGVHHSSLSKDVRIKTETEFKAEKIKSIIATSSLQLGIDVGSVDLTLQYQSPRTVSQLIQRVGRSGHEFSRTSKGIIITTDEDDIFESAAIARKALAEELEPIKFHTASYDVLAHQIVGLTIENWQMELQQVYDIIRRATPYSQLSFKEFLEVCQQLRDLGLIFLNGYVKKKRRGFEYYFQNLSTIPDQKSYRVFNIIDKSYVGTLDEEFVALHSQPNTNFIVKGEAWRIVDTEEDRIYVEPTEDIEAAIPGWEGELIPVPFDVAQEVGWLRGAISSKLDKKGEEEIVLELQQKYPIDENCAKKMIKVVKQQKKYGLVPDDKTILAEDYENLVVLHTCFGTTVNETLGRFIVALLAARVGSVGLKTDPYRIMLQFQTKNLDLVREALFNTSSEFLRSILELSVTKSELFNWKFVHVAKRFGAIERGAEYGKVRMSKIIDSYAGSPIYKETLKELETEKLDVEKATEILRAIQNKKLHVAFKAGLSPLGKLGIKHKYAEVIGPEKPEVEIFELFKQRLLNTKVRMVCVNCGEWHQAFAVKELPKDLKCKKCDARLLGVAHPKNIEIVKIIKKKLRHSELTNEELEKYDRIRKTGDLFLTYREKAAVALAANGVGPQTASRILAKFHKTEEDFLRDILEAERQYIRTKRYWKI